MPLSWSALHARLLGSTTPRSFHDEYFRIRRDNPILTPLGDPGALISALHGNGCSPAEKNALLGALVDRAQSPSISPEAAITLLLLALWPGLDAAHGRLCRGFPSSRVELASEVSARATLQIRALNQSRVRKIAATIVRNVERDIRRELIGRHAEESVAVESTAAQDLVVSEEASAESALFASQLLQCAGADAALLRAVDGEGLPLAEAAVRLGIGYEAARKRRQRALQRLREVSAEI